MSSLVVMSVVNSEIAPKSTNQAYFPYLDMARFISRYRSRVTPRYVSTPHVPYRVTGVGITASSCEDCPSGLLVSQQRHGLVIVKTSAADVVIPRLATHRCVPNII